MRIAAFFTQPNLAQSFQALVARNHWYCHIYHSCAEARIAAARVDIDVLVSDDPTALAPAVTTRQPVCLAINTDHPVVSNMPTLDPTHREAAQRLRTLVNNARFKRQFNAMDSREPITRLPRHTEILEMMSAHTQRPLGLLVAQIDHSDHLYHNLDPVSKTDLLGAVGKRLHDGVPTGEHLGIFDASCFIIGLPNSDRTRLSDVAELLVQTAQAPLSFAAGSVQFTLSVGCAHTPMLGDINVLWQQAWQAMQHAQVRGGNQHCLENPDAIAKHLGGAIAQNEFTLALQPQWSIADGGISGAETLIRWQNVALGELTPEAFIPVAEATGHMARVGDWVVEQACRHTANWLTQRINPVRLGVNVSVAQFHHGALSTQLQRLINDYWLDPNLLELELSLGQMLQLIDSNRDAVYRLRDLGVHFAIDNLGSELIDTTRLLRCPADTLKLDRRLIANFATDASARDLAAEICALANQFKLRTVAVGVERQEQLDLLKDMGCTDVQGYLLSEPVGIEGFEEMLIEKMQVGGNLGSG